MPIEEPCIRSLSHLEGSDSCPDCHYIASEHQSWRVERSIAPPRTRPIRPRSLSPEAVARVGHLDAVRMEMESRQSNLPPHTKTTGTPASLESPAKRASILRAVARFCLEVARIVEA